MEIRILNDSKEAGFMAANKAAELLRSAVEIRGSARFMVATGESQFEFYNAILKMDIPWNKIEIFHLDEYVGLDDTHPASFKKYVKERFVSHIEPKDVYYLNGNMDTESCINFLNVKATESPIDVVMIGFGTNAHIAFNDPPADFETTIPYKVVKLDDKCKMQQVLEGWFESIESVPLEAISATVNFIKSCKNIVSLVPYKVKAQAVKDILESKEITPMIPGTAIKDHENWFLYLDRDSASLIDMSKI